MIIDFVTLQVGDLPSVPVTGLIFAMIIISIAVIAVVVWWYAGQIKTKVDFEGRKICRYRVTIQKKYTIEGNLAHNDSFDEETLEAFEGQEDVKVIKGVIERLKKEKRLYVYNLHVTDDTEAEDEFADKTRIISNVLLEGSEHSWLDQHSTRSFFNPWQAEGRRNAVWLDTTSKYVIYNDETKEEEHWWVPAVLSDSEAKVYPSYRDTLFPDAPINKFVVTILQNAKGLAQFGTVSRRFATALHFNEMLEKERDMWKDLYDSIKDKLEMAHIDMTDSDEELAQKEYVVSGKKAYRHQQQAGAVWLLMSGFVAGLLAILMPEIFPESDSQVVAMFGIGLGLFVIGGGYIYYISKIKPVERIKFSEMHPE